MKCKACGSQSGFQGRQEINPITREPIGEESIYCEKCGEQVFRDAEVIVGIPDHLRESFDDDAEAIADEMLAGFGAPSDVSAEDRAKLVAEIRASKA